ncbi:L,D-transpeptidase Cds6 family protein, partial [Leptospira sp. SA-E8]|uniref:L,D-transpeptidase Cds6 family protein n=1 Tax=Leptospira sp. SA-E8 TaxID=3422259 RepID=UPI003EB8F023
QPFEAILTAWRQAKASGNVEQVLRFYASDFSGFRAKTLRDLEPALREEMTQTAGRAIELQDLSYLRWTDEDDTMVVTFTEVAAPRDGARGGPAKGPLKRQYWSRQQTENGQEWKIIFEGIIG